MRPASASNLNVTGAPLAEFRAALVPVTAEIGIRNNREVTT